MTVPRGRGPREPVAWELGSEDSVAPEARVVAASEKAVVARWEAQTASVAGAEVVAAARAAPEVWAVGAELVGRERRGCRRQGRSQMPGRPQ